MKLNRIITLCAMALALSAGSLLAQDNGGGQGGQGGPGGQGGFRQRGNFDPQQMQQRMMDNIRNSLEFTNDTDWSAVQPLVQKVLDARRDADTGARLMRSLFRRNRGGDNGGNNNRNRGGGMFGTPSPEEQALQNAVDQGAPAGQIKDLLAKYQASQKAKREKLAQAESDLRAVLDTKQEAQATLMGLID